MLTSIRCAVFYNRGEKARVEEEVTQRTPLCNLFFNSGFFSAVIKNTGINIGIYLVRSLILIFLKRNIEPCPRKPI